MVRVAVLGVAFFLGAAMVVAVRASWSDGAQTNDESSKAPACSVTRPNGSDPPGERGRQETHGNGRLWTSLPADGRLVASPVGSPYPPQQGPDGSISKKFPWWGGRSATDRLTITGQRLDARARPLAATVTEGKTRAPQFWATRLAFPTPGCWKVVGRAGKGNRLAFVISVEAPSS